MFCVRVFVAQNICQLYLSFHAFLCSAKFFWGFGILGGNVPPDVPRINTELSTLCRSFLDGDILADILSNSQNSTLHRIRYLGLFEIKRS